MSVKLQARIATHMFCCPLAQPSLLTTSLVINQQVKPWIDWFLAKKLFALRYWAMMCVEGGWHKTKRTRWEKKFCWMRKNVQFDCTVFQAWSLWTEHFPNRLPCSYCPSLYAYKHCNEHLSVWATLSSDPNAASIHRPSSHPLADAKVNTGGRKGTRCRGTLFRFLQTRVVCAKIFPSTNAK